MNPSAIEAAAKARYEDDGFFPEAWDDATEDRRQLERDRIRPVLTAAEPFLLGELRERLLSKLKDWLGSDDEYDALGAIWASLRENPQLVPEHEVPLRFLQALRAAVDRFAALPDSRERTDG